MSPTERATALLHGRMLCRVLIASGQGDAAQRIVGALSLVPGFGGVADLALAILPADESNIPDHVTPEELAALDPSDRARVLTMHKLAAEHDAAILGAALFARLTASGRRDIAERIVPVLTALGDA